MASNIYFKHISTQVSHVLHCLTFRTKINSLSLVERYTSFVFLTEPRLVFFFAITLQEILYWLLRTWDHYLSLSTGATSIVRHLDPTMLHAFLPQSYLLSQRGWSSQVDKNSSLCQHLEWYVYCRKPMIFTSTCLITGIWVGPQVRKPGSSPTFDLEQNCSFQ